VLDLFDPGYQAEPQHHPQYAHMLARGPLLLLAYALGDAVLMKRAAACEDFPGLVTRLRELSARQDPPCFIAAAAKAEACLQKLQEDPGIRRIVDRAEELLQATVLVGRRGATGFICAPFDLVSFGRHIQPAFKSADYRRIQQTWPGMSDMVAQVHRTGEAPTDDQINDLLENVLAMGRGGAQGEGSSRAGDDVESSSSSGAAAGHSGRVKSTKVSKSACVVCGGCQGSTQACGRCKSVWYCSKEHQVRGVKHYAQKDWARILRNCKQLFSPAVCPIYVFASSEYASILSHTYRSSGRDEWG
jgi:hypothetical protein